MNFEPVTPSLETKLPAVGTTIFTVMSALAADMARSTWGRASLILIVIPSWSARSPRP